MQPSPINTSPAGFVVLDAAGAPLFATGAAGDAAALQALASRLAAWACEGDGSTLLTFEAGELAYTAVAVRQAGATACVLFRKEQEDVVFTFAATVGFAHRVLAHLLVNPYEAMMVVDDQGILRFISPQHDTGLGQHVTQVIANTRLHEVVRTGKAEIGNSRESGGAARIVTRAPIRDVEGRVVGAIGKVMYTGPEELRRLNAEVRRLRSEVAFYQRELSGLRDHRGLDEIVGVSPAIRKLKDEIAKVASRNIPVLLVGESGCGKELVAHAIHQLSPRRRNPFVLINSAALPATLVESELFGYESGAFTGAERRGRAGKFEHADNGTMFFDEIGDMPLELQVKLLRVLQDGAFERVGSNTSRTSDFRLICASNRDFQAMVQQGSFRLDLYYRISAVTLHLPPLRERLEDIPLLAAQALASFAARHNASPKSFAPNVIEHLQRHRWPGNVRQLLHAVERAAIFSESDVIHVHDFDLECGQVHCAAPAAAAAPGWAPGRPGGSVRTAVDQVESEMIREAMQRLGGNKKKVAEHLGISRSHLYKRLAGLDTF